MRSFQLAMIQMYCEFGQVEKNLQKSQSLVREATGCGAKLICLPETFSTGHFGDMETFLGMAEPLGGATVTRMRALARDLEVLLLAPVLLRGEGHGCYENTALLIGPDGEILGRYAKTHPVGDERGVLRRGTNYPVFDTPLGRIGICICYDACFPEVTRMLALGGAELILIPSAWRASHYFKEWWDTVLPCRALDNLCYVAAVNQTGPTGSGEELYAGKSQVINPTGARVAALGTDDEAILFCPVYPGRVRKERESNSMLCDRHPEDYGAVTSAWLQPE